MEVFLNVCQITKFQDQDDSSDRIFSSITAVPVNTVSIDLKKIWNILALQRLIRFVGDVCFVDRASMVHLNSGKSRSKNFLCKKTYFDLQFFMFYTY